MLGNGTDMNTDKIEKLAHGIVQHCIIGRMQAASYNDSVKGVTKLIEASLLTPEETEWKESLDSWIKDMNDRMLPSSKAEPEKTADAKQRKVLGAWEYYRKSRDVPISLTSIAERLQEWLAWMESRGLSPDEVVSVPMGANVTPAPYTRRALWLRASTGFGPTPGPTPELKARVMAAVADLQGLVGQLFKV